jgi:hypothetical protein
MTKDNKLTLLSLSLGGSWGSVAERLGGGGAGVLGFTGTGLASTFGFIFSSSFISGADCLGAAFFDVFSEGAA